MICTQYNQYPDKNYVGMCQSYGFDLNKATRDEIGARAVELCDEFSERYAVGSLEHVTFMALKAHWVRTNATR